MRLCSSEDQVREENEDGSRHRSLEVRRTAHRQVQQSGQAAEVPVGARRQHPTLRQARGFNGVGRLCCNLGMDQPSNLTQRPRARQRLCAAWSRFSPAAVRCSSAARRSDDVLSTLIHPSRSSGRMLRPCVVRSITICLASALIVSEPIRLSFTRMEYWVERLDGLVEPRSSPHRLARRLVLKDRIAAFLVQSGQLPAEVLPLSADASVAHLSAHPDPVIFLYGLLSIPGLDFMRIPEAVIKLLLVDQSLHFTSARSRSTAAAIAAERVAGGRRDAHHASSRLSRSGLIVTEITTAAAPRRLRVVARGVLVARAMAAPCSCLHIHICAWLSMLILTGGYIAGVLMSRG